MTTPSPSPTPEDTAAQKIQKDLLSLLTRNPPAAQPDKASQPAAPETSAPAEQPASPSHPAR